MDEYLQRDRASAERNEYLDGEMFAMTGGSPRHALIATNVAAELRHQLRERACTVYSPELRVRVVATGLHSYPDVVVVCGDLAFADERRDTLVNPTLLVEVLSPTTADYDRGRKFWHYRQIPSLREYLLIGQDAPHAEHHLRQGPGRWLLAETDDVASVLQLESIGCVLRLAEAYHKVEP
jgi:Uma2 family endonuclease